MSTRTHAEPERTRVAGRAAGRSAPAGGGALGAAAGRANAGPHASSLAGLRAVVAQRACADCDMVQAMFKRPGFTTDAKKSAIGWHNTRPDRPFEIDEKTPDLPSLNAAMPHRFAWKEIRDSTKKFQSGKEDATDFVRWTDRLIAAGKERIARLEAEIEDADDSEALEETLRRAEASQEAFVQARDGYALTEDDADGKEFLRQANSFHANVPDFGPHRGVNNPVREAGHLNFVEKTDTRGRKRHRSPSPMSRQVLDMSPERLGTGLAFQDEESLITTSGDTVRLDEMSASTRKKVGLFERKIVRSFDPDAQFGPTSTSTGKKSPPRKKRALAPTTGKKPVPKPVQQPKPRAKAKPRPKAKAKSRAKRKTRR